MNPDGVKPIFDFFKIEDGKNSISDVIGFLMVRNAPLHYVANKNGSKQNKKMNFD